MLIDKELRSPIKGRQIKKSKKFLQPSSVKSLTKNTSNGSYLNRKKKNVCFILLKGQNGKFTNKNPSIPLPSICNFTHIEHSFHSRNTFFSLYTTFGSSLYHYPIKIWGYFKGINFRSSLYHFRSKQMNQTGNFSLIQFLGFIILILIDFFYFQGKSF